jgi:hypothetical protein
MCPYEIYKREKKKQNPNMEKWLTSALIHIVKKYKDVNGKYPLIACFPQDKSDTIENIIPGNYSSEYNNICMKIIEKFIKIQYDKRNKLFHAKGNEMLSNIIIPVDIFNPAELSDAYEKLMILLKQILKNYYNIRVQDGVITYCGFKSMMEDNLRNGYKLTINADSSHISENLTEKHMFPLTEDQLGNKNQLHNMQSLISPNKCESIFLLNLQHDTSVDGVVKISGEIDKTELNKIPLMYRTSLVYIHTLFIKFIRLIIFNNKDGLHLDGIEKFETNVYIKLKNKGDPMK